MLTKQTVIDAINEHLNPRGAAVLLEAEHMCMSMRGVRAHGAQTVTQRLAPLPGTRIASTSPLRTTCCSKPLRSEARAPERGGRLSDTCRCGVRCELRPAARRDARIGRGHARLRPDGSRPCSGNPGPAGPFGGKRYPLSLPEDRPPLNRNRGARPASADCHCGAEKLYPAA